ncbi:TetR/AcrR family transcriptional regulator [Actinocorallia aurantiaca]|uniref:HTH tetR-type domain-containing protein n=1 Tax=Actinocorallia aurantiaca TaxID=46204 RepID=A0ABP6GQV5_9ACTN
MEGVEEDRFLEVATRLFAELGFDGTPMQLIADAAGVDVETLVEQTGDKSRLYRKVMLRTHALERAALTEAAASFTPTRQGVIALVDAYLDFHVAHPQVLALWMHRWIGDAADIPGPEGQVRTLSTLMAATAQGVAAPGVDPEYLVWTIVWCVFGYLSGGIQHPGPSSYHARGEPLSPQALAGFRAYLHVLITRMTVTSGDGEEAS